MICWLFSFLVALMVATQAYAQQPITFQYFYDELGQVVKVVDSTGTVIEYVYDEVGNIVEIKRTSVAGLAIFNFTPQQGPVTTQVTIQGQGFSATPLDNTVRFNGVTAEVITATPATIITRVPLGATTGPITVTVGGETATSSQHFTVTNAPVITSITPKTTLTGTTLPNVMITGLNLTDSTFTFLPVFVPPVITINTATIDPSGTAATLHVTIGSQAGQFVLVATNGEGSSDSAATAGNTLGVLSPQQLNDDTDGDGFQDGLEFILGSDPFDPSSVPDPEVLIDETVSPIFSIVNLGSAVARMKRSEIRERGRCAPDYIRATKRRAPRVTLQK